MKHDMVLIENQFLKLNKAQKKLLLTQKQIDAFLDLIHGPGYTTPAEHFMLLNSINFALKPELCIRMC